MCVSREWTRRQRQRQRQCHTLLSHSHLHKIGNSCLVGAGEMSEYKRAKIRLSGNLSVYASVCVSVSASASASASVLYAHLPLCRSRCSFVPLLSLFSFYGHLTAVACNQIHLIVSHTVFSLFCMLCYSFSVSASFFYLMKYPERHANFSCCCLFHWNLLTEHFFSFYARSTSCKTHTKAPTKYKIKEKKKN